MEETRSLSLDGTPLLRSPDLLSSGLMLCHAQQDNWPVEYIGRTCASIIGLPISAAVGSSLWGLFCMTGMPTSCTA